MFSFRCCLLKRESEGPAIYIVNPEQAEAVSNVGGMAGVLSGMKRKDTPPPPYEDPPSYHLAVQMETQGNSQRY